MNDPSPSAVVGAAEADRAVTHRDVIAIALPIMLSNATTPLIGLVDTMVIGQVGAAHLIGGVAIAANIFGFIYWMFAFLRMGTTGFTAQAVGARDHIEVTACLRRAVLVACACGALLIVLQVPLIRTALALMGASPEASDAARTYFDIRIWAAPAGLLNFAILGWLIGLGRAGLAVGLQILLNLLNVALAAWLVLGLSMGVAGVAIATLIAEWAAAIAGLGVAAWELRWRSLTAQSQDVTRPASLRRMVEVNADIMARTVCVLLAFLTFTALGARAGDVTLAANALLHSIAMVTVFLLDGFAFAVEALVGRSIGAQRRDHYRQAVRLSTGWAAAVALGLTTLVWFGGGMIIDTMTPNPDVRAAARGYLVWAALTPVAGIWCFLLDGIYIGATRTADMRNMMALSLAAYLILLAVLLPPFANHGLWLAIIGFYLVRAITLYWRLPRLERAMFGEQPMASTRS